VNQGPGIEDLLRDLAPQVLGAVMRRFGDFDAAEDAVQEALVAAALHWPRETVPANPRGWLIQTAVRRMTDQLRSEQARRRREIVAATRDPAAAEVLDRDDTLILLFMCCHQVLTPASAIALTLRAVGGLTTAEDRKRVPGARGDDGAADQPGQAAHQELGRAVPDAVG